MRFKTTSNFLLGFLFIILLTFIISCSPGTCDPPSGRGTVTVVTTLPPPAFNDCNYNITTLQTESNIVRELNEGDDKWIVEFIVGGSCSNGKPWTMLLKKGDFTMVRVRGEIAFRLNNIPVSDGPIDIQTTFYTPCNKSITMGSCATTNNGPWRNVLGGNLKVDNPSNGLTVEFNSANKIRESHVRTGCQ